MKRPPRWHYPALAACLLLIAAPATADDEGDDPFAQFLFAPELVMSHQNEIGLTEDQRSALVRELQQTQSDVTPFQLDMAAVGEILTRELRAAEIDEASALAAADRIMELETQVKRRHLALVIRIKNLLTPAQQARLHTLRE